MAEEFATAMKLMRKGNPQLQEDGFGMLRAMAPDVLADLVEAYEAEDDHGLRCWLLELIGDAKSDAALPLLVRELGSSDDALRGWARRGLEGLGTKDARTALWKNQHSRSQ